ncbi:MAG: 23S rRNA (adenine(2503)-C(2))-methyltransferase RlmN [Candidatus Wallbacteria bacterium]|nr:23S rRNA (adenine(2503)-C(2))-methyltransferase RlmN [Candidatus Wallbacteria bacterium]
MNSVSSTSEPDSRPSDFFALTAGEFRERVRSLGLPAYRGEQVLAWVYKRFVADFDEMSDLSKPDRSALGAAFRFRLPSVSRVSRSSDRLTTKLLLALDDGAAVEGVVMHHPRRRPTLCVSVQVGCAQGCLFCATGSMGLSRNMTAAEILAEIWLLRRHMIREDKVDAVPTLVFMGMGEPLDNEEGFFRALAMLNSQEGFGLGSRKITVSTVGGPDRIRRLAELGLQLQLAVSLHAATDSLRGRLVPGQKGVAVAELVDAARYYFQKTGREVTFEYVVIQRVNDSEEDATRLAGLLRGFPGKVNLIPFNPVSHNAMKPPEPEALARFRELLTRASIKVTIRHSQGRDINAACGQLAVRERQASTPQVMRYA